MGTKPSQQLNGALDAFRMHVHICLAYINISSPTTGATFEGREQPHCWSGTGKVSELLGMHVIHPHKIALSEKSWDFALTLNPPGGVMNLSAFSGDSSEGAAAWPTVQSATTASPFWCGSSK